MKKQITLEQLYEIIDKSNEDVYIKNNMVFFGIDYHIADGIVFNSNEPILKIPENKRKEVIDTIVCKQIAKGIQKAARNFVNKSIAKTK